MFEKIFHTVIEISLGTSVVIFLFLVTKPLLDKRYSAKWRYCVWLILALRLITPFRFSFVRSAAVRVGFRFVAVCRRQAGKDRYGGP